MADTIRDPQQELYSAILVLLREKFGNENVYDGRLPPDNTPYPFVYLADNQFIDDGGNKTQLLGDCYQTIHVWHNNFERRGTVSSMMLSIKLLCRQIIKTKTYSWTLINADQRIITDNTTKTPLMHGVIELHYQLKGDHS